MLRCPFLPLFWYLAALVELRRLWLRILVTITPRGEKSHPGDLRARQNKGVVVGLKALNVNHLASAATKICRRRQGLHDIVDGRSPLHDTVWTVVLRKKLAR